MDEKKLHWKDGNLIYTDEPSIMMMDKAVELHNMIMANRESFCKAWLAATGYHPTECVMLERQIPVDGGMQVEIKFAKREDEDKKIVKVQDDEATTKAVIAELEEALKFIRSLGVPEDSQIKPFYKVYVYLEKRISELREGAI